MQIKGIFYSFFHLKLDVSTNLLKRENRLTTGHSSKNLYLRIKTREADRTGK